MTKRRDAGIAMGVGLAAFVVYVKTLAPGLITGIDSPVFQFVGRVLGIPHNPGYPLYVLLTFPFSYVPVGTLPYRINLFSAVMAGVTVSLVYLLARRLDSGRLISAASALALAFGFLFWSQSVIAEVYTLDTAITTGMLLALIAWGETKRQGAFYLGVALLAIGLGNHTTILAFAPGMALYALWKDRRFVLRVRTLVISALIMAAGVSQYLFILIRSQDPDAYAESRAASLRELWGIMRGEDFAVRVFAFPWRDVVTHRLPWLLDEVVLRELTIPGAALAVIGCWRLCRRRTSEAVLLISSAAAFIAFAVNYDVSDIQVFFIPAVLIFWIFAAAGAQQIAAATSRVTRSSMAIAGALFMLLPAWHLWHNYSIADRSYDTFTAVHMDGLVSSLPPGTAIVREDFLVDRIVMFKLLGEGAAKRRDLTALPRNAEVLLRARAGGQTVVAFAGGARRLRQSAALDFSFASRPLAQGTLDMFLSRLRPGTPIAAVIPARHAAAFAASAGATFRAAGHPTPLPAAPEHTLVVGVTGTSGGAIAKHDRTRAVQSLGPDEPIGDTGTSMPAALELDANDDAAVVRQANRELARTSEGVVLAVWVAEDRYWETYVLEPAAHFRVPIPTGALSVYELRGEWPRRDVVSSSWTNIRESIASGVAMFRVPSRSRLVAYAGHATPLAPRVVSQSAGRPGIEIRELDDTARLAAIRDDGLDARDVTTRYLYRIEITPAANTEASITVAFGGAPDAAVARTAGARSTGAQVFAVNTDGLLRRTDSVSEILVMSRDEQAQLIGAGWAEPASDRVRPFRNLEATEGRLLLPVSLDGIERLRVEARSDATTAGETITLRVNGVRLPPQPLRTGWHLYEWTTAPGLVRRGNNEVSVVVGDASPGTAPAGQVRVAVATITAAARRD